MPVTSRRAVSAASVMREDVIMML